MNVNTTPFIDGVNNNHRHVAVLAFPFGTHAAPLLTLVRSLAVASPSVQFSFFSTARSNASTFSMPKNSSPIDNVKAYDVSDGIPEGHKLGTRPTEVIGYFLKVARGNFETAVEAAVAECGREITCFVTDAFFWFAGDMAEEMGVRWVPVWTAGPCSVSVHIYTDLIREKLGENGDETLDFIPGCSSITVRDLPEGIISGDLKSPMSAMLHNMGRMLPRATAVAINSFQEIDPTITKDLKSKLKLFLNVGPFTLSSPQSTLDEHNCLSWLDKQKPSSVAHISFGTMITPPSTELKELAQGLEESGVPFLWSFRGDPNDQLPEGFMERTEARGKFVPWAPQLQVLQHVSTGVFVTHCGWNSIMESITGGVPMICRPFFGDQPLNRKVVQDVWRIGVGVENGIFTKSGTVACLELVLKNDGAKMRDRLKGLKELAMKAVEKDGSSVKDFQTLVEVVTGSALNFKGF